MKLTSKAFREGESIPKIHTCEGEDREIPLEVDGIPDGTKSLALIMDDPDVPEWVRKDRMFVHWVTYDCTPQNGPFQKGTEGVNTTGKSGFIGPCPPDREHRYFFKLYALDSMLHLPAGATKEALLKAMQGHILAEAQLMGRYVKES